MDNLEQAIPLQLIETALNVTVYEAAEQSYITGQLLPAAWESCADFVNRPVYPTQADLEAAPLDETALVAPFKFKQAVLLTLGHLYRNREATTTERLIALPLGVQSLLWPMRARLGV